MFSLFASAHSSRLSQPALRRISSPRLNRPTKANTGGDTTCLPLPIAGAESRLNSFWGLSERRRSLAKINLLIAILTRFRDALSKEIALIEKAKAK